MDSKKNFDIARAIVVNYANAHAVEGGRVIDMDQVEYLRAVRKDNTLMILLRVEESDNAFYKVVFTDKERNAHLSVYKCVENTEIIM